MIRIIADTTCGLPLDLLRSLDIPTLPQIIIFGEQAYRDDNEIDTPTFLKMLRGSPILPKTAAPQPLLYCPIFDELLARGDELIVLTPSSDVSGTYRSAVVAAQDYPGAPIHVVDTRTVAAGLGRLVLEADRWARQGLDAATIISRVQDLAGREQVYFIVDTLEYLHKGGRIGGAKALIGSLLEIKPILTLRDGRVEQFETQRTKKRAVARVHELTARECPRDPEAALLTICHCDALDEAEAMRQDMQQQLGFTDIPIYQVPPAIVVHGGPKILEISFFRQPA